jgi:hypothetical protein
MSQWDEFLTILSAFHTTPNSYRGMVFIFIWPKITPLYPGWISSGLRGMKEGGVFLHLRVISKG